MDSANENNKFPCYVYPVEPQYLIDHYSEIHYEYEREHAGANTFSELLQSYMEYPIKVTQYELSARTGLSVSTIHRMLSAEKMNYNPPLQNVIACIVGLHIDFMASEKLLNLAGYNLNLETKRNRLYRAIVRLYYNASMVDCNNFLECNHEKALTKNQNILSPHAVDWTGKKVEN